MIFCHFFTAGCKSFTMFFGGFPGFDEGMRRPSGPVNTTKLYDLLDVSKEATQAEIKKVCHPFVILHMTF